MTIALMRMVVVACVYPRADTQLSTLNAQRNSNPAASMAEGTSRMQNVVKDFSIYKTIEMVPLIVGDGRIAFAAPRHGRSYRGWPGLMSSLYADAQCGGRGQGRRFCVCTAGVPA
ncbi:hypothetical protein [Simplicispira suum]|uniref:hypothetical protein n=1 Tax=Simplicispira suum TaxID=2109915 RepID=UPI0011B23266|nr:hypothetical protein [Simplicispira suum]